MSPEVTKRKIVQIDTYLEELKKLSELDLNNLTMRDIFAAERIMQLLLDTAVDLLSHLLKDRFQVKIKTYSEVFVDAGKYGLMDELLSEKFTDFACFRNRMVHQYGDISGEEAIVWIEPCIGMFTEFIRQVKDKV